MLENYKIGKLEFRIATYLSKTPTHPSYDIVRWFPNRFYGKESEYVKVDENNYRHPSVIDYFINKKCFENPESCIVIATFYYNEGKYHYRFIDNQGLSINPEHLTKLVTYGKKQLGINE